MHLPQTHLPLHACQRYSALPAFRLFRFTELQQDLHILQTLFQRHELFIRQHRKLFFPSFTRISGCSVIMVFRSFIARGLNSMSECTHPPLNQILRSHRVRRSPPPCLYRYGRPTRTAPGRSDSHNRGRWARAQKREGSTGTLPTGSSPPTRDQDELIASRSIHRMRALLARLPDKQATAKIARSPQNQRALNWYGESQPSKTTQTCSGYSA